MEEIKNNKILAENEKSNFDLNDAENNKGTAALSYFFILVLIPLFIRRSSRFVQAHVRQGLLLCVVEIIAAFVFWVPVLGWLLALAILAAAIYGISQALSGKYSPLPILGVYAEKIKI